MKDIKCSKSNLLWNSFIWYNAFLLAKLDWEKVQVLKLQSYSQWTLSLVYAETVFFALFVASQR